MKRYVYLQFILIWLMTATQAYAAKSDFKIIAVVNEQVISSQDVDDRIRLALFASGLKDSPEIRQKLKPQIIQVLVDEALYRQEAQRLGYEISDQDIEKSVSRIEERNKLGKGQLTSHLESNGVPVRVVMSQIRSENLWEKIVLRKIKPQIKITESDIDEGLEHIARHGGLGEVNLSEIILPVDSPKAEQEVSQLAQKLVSELDAGAPFASVAQQFSRSATASKGGEIGWIPQNQLSPEIINAVRVLEKGHVSRPFRTPEGYHILRLNDRRNKEAEQAPIKEYQVRQAFIPFSKNMTEKEKLDLTENINAKRSDVKNCDAFSDIANEINSTVPADMTTVKLDQFTPSIAEAIQTTAVGNTTNIVRSDDGLYWFMVCNSHLAKATTEERNKIRDILFRQKISLFMKRYIQDLRRNAFIEIKG